MHSELITEPVWFFVTSICLFLFMEPQETLLSGNRKVKFLFLFSGWRGGGQVWEGKL